MSTGLYANIEEEGFIWGGKWPMYDTMHFEYRPELILLSLSPTVPAWGYLGTYYALKLFEQRRIIR
jgi:hypothetical protein